MNSSNRKAARLIIYAVESGGQVYGNANYSEFAGIGQNTNNEKYITIGAGQWYGPEAGALLKEIRTKYPAKFKSLDTQGISADIDSGVANRYKITKTSAKAKCILNIINSTEGRKCQDDKMDAQIDEYILYAKNLGVDSLQAQIMSVNIKHLGGDSALKRILGLAYKPYTLDEIYHAMDHDTGTQVGGPIFRSRQVFVYNNIKSRIVDENASSVPPTSNSQTSSSTSLVKSGQSYANKFISTRLTLDGSRGPATTKAGIKVLQHAINLDFKVNIAEDGSFGPNSQAALRGHFVQFGEIQYLVTALEILLMLKGYDTKGVEFPGSFGDGLKSTLGKYQVDHDLEKDYYAGYNTFISLIS